MEWVCSGAKNGRVRYLCGCRCAGGGVAHFHGLRACFVALLCSLLASGALAQSCSRGVVSYSNYGHGPNVLFYYGGATGVTATAAMASACRGEVLTNGQGNPYCSLVEAPDVPPYPPAAVQITTGLSWEGPECAAAPPPDPLVAVCGLLKGQTVFSSVPGTAAADGTICADTGCGMKFSGTVMRIGSGASAVTKGDAVFTGGICTPDPAAAAVPDSCPDGATGEVNGLTVCVPPSDTNVIESFKSGTTTTTDTGGTGTSTVSSSESTVCSGGRCTTTITTTSGTGTGTVTRNEPQSDVCKRDPTLPGCAASGQFSGSCATSFSCKGDVVQCATAKAVNDQYCKLKDVFEMDDATRTLAEAVQAGTWVVDPKQNPTIVPLGVFDQANPLGESCPPDVTVQMSWGTFVVPMLQHCDRFKMVGNLLVMFSLIGATLFVVRGS